MSYVLIFWIFVYGEHTFASKEVRSPAACWTLMGEVLAAARRDVIETGIPFPIIGVRCFKPRMPAVRT